MPVLNLNSNTPTSKNARKLGRNATKGHLRGQGPSSLQHPATVSSGTSYSNPFTTTDANPLQNQINTATISQRAPNQVEQPGVIVPLKDFVKVHPAERSMSYNRERVPRVVNPGGGGSPSKSNDTPTNPNARPKPIPRPKRFPTKPTELVTTTTGSFLNASPGTLSSKANHDENGARWNKTKVGAAG